MNSHPNTPFGKFFAKIGIWHPTIEEAIEELYNNLDKDVKVAVKEASSWIAIINTNLDKAPDFVFDLIQKKFPNVTKEHITDSLNKVNAAIMKVDDVASDDFGTSLGKLQTYLGQHKGNTWITITRSVVSL